MDLRPLIDGLLYPSEDDRPFEALDWGTGPASAGAAVAQNVPAGAVVEQLTPAAFFDPLRGTTDGARFGTLHRGLAAGLADLSAFRVSDGSAEVRIFLVGRDRDGRWVGVRTASVET
jgi:hypothetical protein